jgi:hypothetical protein
MLTQRIHNGGVIALITRVDPDKKRVVSVCTG